MKDLKLLICILILFTIGLMGVIIILNIQNKNNETKNIVNVNNISEINSNNVIQQDVLIEAPKLTFNTKLQQVNENATLYSISNNINSYFNYIKEGNIQAVNELGGNNIYEITGNVKYVVKKAYLTANKYQERYYTYGILKTTGENNIEKEVLMAIFVDLKNSTYKLETITKEQILNLSELSQEENIEILPGTYNVFKKEYVDNVKQMEIYLEDYTFEIFNNIEKAYNLLNEQYKIKRFGNINIFNRYVIEKQKQLKNIKIVQYNIIYEGGNKIYIGTDKYGNYYHITEKSYMKYEVILDNYTMQNYSNLSRQEKIEKSAEKFILMINAADYTNAYNLLETTFKKNNFPTEQDFINYIKNNWFERNIIASKEVTDDGICIVTIKQTLSAISNKMQKQFKVTLGEGMNFTIEFSM